MDDLPCTDEVKVYQDEGEEVEEQVKSSENLTEDKVGLVIESEGQIPRLFDLLTSKANNATGENPSASPDHNLFRLPMFQANPRLASCLLPGYPAAIAAVMASLQAVRNAASMNETNSSQENGSSSAGSSSFSIWSNSTSNSENNNTSNLLHDFQQNFAYQNPLSPGQNGHRNLFGFPSPLSSQNQAGNDFQSKFQRLIPPPVGANENSSFNLLQSANRKDSNGFANWSYNNGNNRSSFDQQNCPGSLSGMDHSSGSGGLYAACAAAMAAISSTWGQKNPGRDRLMNNGPPNKRGRKKQPRKDMGSFSPFSAQGNNSSAQSSPLSSTMLTNKLLALSAANGSLTSPNSPQNNVSLWQKSQMKPSLSVENLLAILDDVRPSQGSMQRLLKLKRQCNITKMVSDRMRALRSLDELPQNFSKMDEEREVFWLRMRAKYSKFKFTSFSDDLHVTEQKQRPKRPRSSNAVLAKTRSKRSAFSVNEVMKMDQNADYRFKTEDFWGPGQDFQSHQLSGNGPSSDLHNPFSFDHNKILNNYTSQPTSNIPPPPFYTDFANNFAQKSNLNLTNYTSPQSNQLSHFMGSSGNPQSLHQSQQQQQQAMNPMKFQSYSHLSNNNNHPHQPTKHRSYKKYPDDNMLPTQAGTQSHRLMNHPGNELTGGSMKKCRARFGLEHQNLWCKPCRRKKKCIRFISEQDLEQQQENKQRTTAQDKGHFNLNDLMRHQQQAKPRPKKVSTSGQMENTNFFNFLRNQNQTQNSVFGGPLEGSQPTNQNSSIGSMMAAMLELNRPKFPTDIPSAHESTFSMGQDLLGSSDDFNLAGDMKRRKLNNVFPSFIDDIGTDSKLIAQ